MVSEIKIDPVEESIHPIDSLKPLIDKTEPIKYGPVPRKDVSVTIPSSALGSTQKLEATLTLVLSDTHVGDSDFLPKTFTSCIEETKRVVEALANHFLIRNFILILNGDIVSGRQVYRYQYLRNLVQRGHWQIELGAQLIRELVETLNSVCPINKTFVLKGNHEGLGENYMIYLTNYLPNTWYAGHYKVINIAHPIGNYNVLFTHGFSNSDYYPVPYAVVRDCWKAFNQFRSKGIWIEEICTGHTHWLQPRLYLEGLTFNVTGGFQRWEKTISQRPSGVLLFVHVAGETSVTGIKPDPTIQSKEEGASDLEFTNLEFYSRKLRDAITYLKYKDQPEEIVL